MSQYVYHERQLGALCGVHCLNNLLQGAHFGPGDLAEIGVQLDDQEREHQERQSAYNVDTSADGGNFSIQVLTLALKRFSLELLPSRHPSAKPMMRDPTQATQAFVVQQHSHWFAVRAVGGHWWNLNSTRPYPSPIREFYLAAWLTQLTAEGHSIFFVVGKDLPLPKAPAQESRADEENLYDLGALLEQAKVSKQAPFGPAADSEPSFDGAPDPGQESWHRGLGLDARRTRGDDGGASTDNRFNAVRASQAAALEAIKARRLKGEIAAEAERQAVLAESRRFRPTGSRREDCDVGSLLEMGYKMPQINAAFAIAGYPHQRLCSATGLLLKVKGVPPSVEHDPARLAQSLQDGVLALDKAYLHAEQIMELVTLLCIDADCLKAASEQVDGAALTEVALAAIATHGADWRPEIKQAAGLVIEQLLGLPGCEDEVERRLSHGKAATSTRDIARHDREESVVLTL